MIVKFLGSLSIGFLAGVLLHSLLDTTPFSLGFIITLIVVGVIFCTIFPYKKIVIIGVFIIGTAFGVLRFSVHINEQASTSLDLFAENETHISLYGEIINDPIHYLSYTELVVQIHYLSSEFMSPVPLDTRILVKTDIYSDYEYGQKILISGVVEKPTSFVTETNREFDYQSYLAKDQVFYTMRFAETKILNAGTATIQRSLYRLKHFFLERSYRLIPEPESGLLAGILFGEKNGLSDEGKEKFRIVGLMHIVVLSGYNVSLVIQLMLKTLIFLPIRIRALFALLGIISFALLVGAGPTVIRASVMAMFIVVAEMMSVQYRITRALYIAGYIMVLMNPRILYFDISFQLSFLATYGLIVLTPWLQSKLSFLPKIFAIQESAIATIAAQIMVLPLLLYQIGEFSLVSPLVNILVLFAVPYAMFFGFIASIIGNVLAPIGMILGLITTYLLRYQLVVVDFFAYFSFSSITVPAFHWVFMLFGYIGIYFWIRNTSTYMELNE